MKTVLTLLLAGLFYSFSYTQPVVGPLMASKWKTFEWPMNGSFPEANPNLCWSGKRAYRQCQWDYSAPGKVAALHLDNSSRTEQNSIQLPYQPFLSLPGSFTVDFWFRIDSWGMTFNRKPAILTKEDR